MDGSRRLLRRKQARLQGKLKHVKQGLEGAENRFKTEAYGGRRLQRRQSGVKTGELSVEG